MYIAPNKDATMNNQNTTFFAIYDNLFFKNTGESVLLSNASPVCYFTLNAKSKLAWLLFYFTSTDLHFKSHFLRSSIPFEPPFTRFVMAFKLSLSANKFNPFLSQNQPPQSEQ